MRARGAAAFALTTLLAGACGGAGKSVSPTPTTSTPTSAPTAVCSDTTTGVCRIADAGLRHIRISRAGANGLVVDTATGWVYVAINGVTSPWCGDVGTFQTGLSLVDGAAGMEVATVATGESPVWPFVDSQRGKVYVAGSGGQGTVVTHDARSGAIERIATVGGRPHDLGLDPAGPLMVVSNTFDRSQTFASVLDVATGVVAANIPVPFLPHKVVVDAGARVAYVASLGAGEITAVDLTTGAKLREFTSGPIPQTSAMIYSPLRRRLYVGKTAGAMPGAGTTIVAVDPGSGAVVGEAGTFTPASPTPARAWGGFGLDDGQGLLYAAMGNTNFVAVVDVAAMKPVAIFEVDACPWAVALDVGRDTGYVSSNQSAMVTAFSLSKVMRAIGR